MNTMILCFQIEKEEEFDNNNEGRKNDASSYKPTSDKCGVFCYPLISIARSASTLKIQRVMLHTMMWKRCLVQTP